MYNNEKNVLNILNEYSKNNWNIAVDYFNSDLFRKSIKRNNDMNHMYKIILDNNNKEEALDKFLKLFLNKGDICYYLNEKSIYIDSNIDSEYSFNLYKKGYGYIDIDIYTDSKFISIKNKKLAYNHFDGDVTNIRFSILKDKLKSYRNTAYIIINKNLYYKIIIYNKPDFEYVFNKNIYDKRDRGNLKIVNNIRKDISIDIYSSSKYIKFYDFKYRKNYIDIPFSINIKKNYIMKNNMAIVKGLYYILLINIKLNCEGTIIETKKEIKILA